MTLGATRWWWVRHAPVPDPESRITGRLDLPCDISDEAWIAALGRRLPRPALLVDSGLMRCGQTIGALEAAGLALPPPIVEPDLQEQDFGHWQGRSWGDLASAEDPHLHEFWADPAGAAPPGGESFTAVVARVQAVIARLSGDQNGRDILAVAHAGTIRAALAIALEVPPATALSFVIDPLSLTRIDITPQGSRVVMVNWLPE